MGVHKKRFCIRGHDTAIVGRHTNGGCRQCRRQREREVQRDRARGIERVSLASVRVPFAPLEAWLLACGSPEIYGHNLSRAFYRWRTTGVPLMTADRVCCEMLGVHPHAVWGDAWFTFGEETA